MRNTSTTRDFFNQKKDKGNEEKWRPVSDSFTQHAGSYVRWTCLLCLDCMLWLLYRQYCELAAGLSYVCFHLPRCSHVKLRSTWLRSPADKKKKATLPVCFSVICLCRSKCQAGENRQSGEGSRKFKHRQRGGGGTLHYCLQTFIENQFRL